MRNTADSSTPPRRADAVPYVLAVGAILLAWQIVIQPIVLRAPPEIAIRVAPGSPLVLRRAAEGELAAARNENAAALSRDALGRSPFDVRALRVVGLTEARAGRSDQANELLTLAGNWSLRDDPTHAWLMEQRLRNGDYVSSFAHADTLARRREDIQPQLFNLFTAAATSDPLRVIPVLTRLLAAKPPWRSAYLSSLHARNDGLQVAASLALTLQGSRAPLTTQELQDLYLTLLAKGQVPILTAVRERLNRPATGAAVTNGGFDDATAPEPFQWSLIQKAGAVAEIMNDDVAPSNSALRVEYDGYSAANFVRQRVFLSPGRYRFRAGSRTEAGEPAGRLEWTLTCDPGGQSLFTAGAVGARPSSREGWTPSTMDFSVPQGCLSQWLELRGRPLDSRSPMVVWFDQIVVTPVRPTGN